MKRTLKRITPTIFIASSLFKLVLKDIFTVHCMCSTKHFMIINLIVYTLQRCDNESYAMSVLN